MLFSFILFFIFNKIFNLFYTNVIQRRFTLGHLCESHLNTHHFVHDQFTNHSGLTTQIGLFRFCADTQFSSLNVFALLDSPLFIVIIQRLTLIYKFSVNTRDITIDLAQ